jgi:hypothetical protein
MRLKTKVDDLYIMQMGKTGAIKVGRSIDPARRLKQLQTGCPYEIKLILVAKSQGYRERELHVEMKRFRVRTHKGEWFSEHAIGSIPVDLYEQIELVNLELLNGDWWKHVREPLW